MNYSKRYILVIIGILLSAIAFGQNKDQKETRFKIFFF